MHLRVEAGWVSEGYSCSFLVFAVRNGMMSVTAAHRCSIDCIALILVQYQQYVVQSFPLRGPRIAPNPLTVCPECVP